MIGTTTAWLVLAFATAFLVLGTVVKYLVPGRQLKASGVPNRTLLAGALLGFVGFFVIPVVGLFVGFVLGIYLAERARVGGAVAWPSTKHALRAVGVVSAIGKGRHTSTSAVALRLPGVQKKGDPGWIIDTPGIRSFGLAHVSAESLLHGFPDLVEGLVLDDTEHVLNVGVEVDAGVGEMGALTKPGQSRDEDVMTSSA